MRVQYVVPRRCRAPRLAGSCKVSNVFHSRVHCLFPVVVPLTCVLTTGRHTFDFAFVTDSMNNEMTCFGKGLERRCGAVTCCLVYSCALTVRALRGPGACLADKTAVGMGYSSSDAWMYRCFNGELYEQGSTLSCNTKVHPGDTISMHFDMDAGTLSYTVNGTMQPTVFTSLAGAVCVCFTECFV